MVFWFYIVHTLVNCWHRFGYRCGSKIVLICGAKNGVRKKQQTRGQRPVTNCACRTFVPRLFVMFWPLFWVIFMTQNGTPCLGGNQWFQFLIVQDNLCHWLKAMVCKCAASGYWCWKIWQKVNVYLESRQELWNNVVIEFIERNFKSFKTPWTKLCHECPKSCWTVKAGGFTFIKFQCNAGHWS